MEEAALRDPTEAEPPDAGREQPGSTCLNCGAKLAGRYCHRCGQDAEVPRDLRAFLSDGIGDVLSFRSRTLKSLFEVVFRPGRPTRAYLDGRRSRYTAPLQLYFIAAAAFFLVNSVRPFIHLDDDWVVRSSLSTMNTGQSIPKDRLDESGRSAMSEEVFRQRFRDAVNQTLPPFMIGSIVLFTLALALFHPRRPALAHAVFALHWVAFFMLAMTVERALPLPSALRGWATLLISIAALVHLIVSLARVYGDRWWRAVLGGLGLNLLFQLILIFWVVAAVAFSVRSL